MPRTISAVSSVLPSSITMTSTAVPAEASADSTQPRILAASLRAGIRMETRVPVAGRPRSRGNRIRLMAPKMIGSRASARGR